MTPLWGMNNAFTVQNITNYNEKDKPPKDTIPSLNASYGFGTQNFMLPMPKDTPGYTNAIALTGERRLVTLFVKTGQIVTNSIESFNVLDTNAPFYDAQSGIKESQ